jgi:hypothetical protein
MSDETVAPLLAEIEEPVSLQGEIMARHEALIDQANAVTQQTRRLLVRRLLANVGRRVGKPTTGQP